MRRWLDFAGGVLVGFGVAAYVFLAVFWIAYHLLLHHLFVMGVSRPVAAVLFLSLPAFSILLGIAVMTLRKRAV